MQQFDLHELSDDLIVDLIADGDTDAFAVMTHRYGSQMRMVALRYTGCVTDADDVVQEALVTAWQKISSLHDGEALRSWLLRITARKAIDLVRQRKTSYQLDDTDPGQSEALTARSRPDDQVLASASAAEVERILNQLPPQLAQCWTLRHGADMTYAQIAKELGTTTTTVRGRLARARQLLMEQMEGWR